MNQVLFYAMKGEKMCFQHILLNALDLEEAGYKARIIFEGASVKLVKEFEESENPLYLKAKEKGLIAGVCVACSKAMDVLEYNQKTGLPMLDDMKGHAGIKSYMDSGYQVISM